MVSSGNPEAELAVWRAVENASKWERKKTVSTLLFKKAAHIFLPPSPSALRRWLPRRFRLRRGVRCANRAARRSLPLLLRALVPDNPVWGRRAMPASRHHLRRLGLQRNGSVRNVMTGSSSGSGRPIDWTCSPWLPLGRL